MRKILLLCFIIIGGGSIHAQSSNPEIISSAGDSFQGANMQIDWTLGELAINTLQSPSLLLTQGFHQPVYTITSLAELPVEVGQISVFPNPGSAWLEVLFAFDQNRQVQIQLFDLQGRLLTSNALQGQEFSKRMDIRKFASGHYVLNIFVDGTQYSQSFIIQKRN